MAPNRKQKAYANEADCGFCGRQNHIEDACLFKKKYNQKQKSTIAFVVSTGTIVHVTNRGDLTENFKTLDFPVRLNPGGALAERVGDLHLKYGNQKVVLKDVFYCPGAFKNILQPFKIKGMEEMFMSRDNITLTMKNSTEMIAGKGDIGLYELIFKVDQQMHVPEDESSEKAYIMSVYSMESLEPSKIVVAKKPLEAIYSAICPVEPTTHNGYNYFVTFTDQYTQYCNTYLLKEKAGLLAAFKDYITKSEDHFNHRHSVESLHCEDATEEYISRDMKKLCLEQFITCQIVVLQIGTFLEKTVSLLKNKQIMERMRATLKTAELADTFWGDAALMATYLINAKPTEDGETPYEKWHNRKPTANSKLFGATVFCKKDNTKMGIFVGYTPNGYKIYDPIAETYVTALKDAVTFDEKNFVTTRPRSSNPTTKTALPNSEGW